LPEQPAPTQLANALIIYFIFIKKSAIFNKNQNLENMENYYIPDPITATELDDHLENIKKLILIKMEDLSDPPASPAGYDEKSTATRQASRLDRLNQAIKLYIPGTGKEKRDWNQSHFLNYFPPSR
jgi:hypothetical protein